MVTESFKNTSTLGSVTVSFTLISIIVFAQVILYILLQSQTNAKEFENKLTKFTPSAWGKWFLLTF